MEENFDIDKHIDKIKGQIEEVKQEENSNISDVPENILKDIPNEEPSLEGYGDDENISDEAENLTDEDVQQSEEYPQTPESEWEDPFGTHENDAVKKYVIYIAKDLVPFVDDMDKDARSAYVNDAIELKVKMEGKDRKWHTFTTILRHIIVSVFTLLIAVPALFWIADKSITATVQNYEYVQKNFEKLYKEKADRDKAAREIQQMRLGL